MWGYVSADSRHTGHGADALFVRKAGEDMKHLVTFIALEAFFVVVCSVGTSGIVSADVTGDSITVIIAGPGAASQDNLGNTDDPVDPSRAVDNSFPSFYAIGANGEVIITFLDNLIVDGPGVDITIWDRCDISRPVTFGERVNVDVALGSGAFRNALTDVAPDGEHAIPAPISFELCPIDIDLADVGLFAADRVRIVDLDDTASDVAGIDIVEVVALNSGILVDIDIKPNSESNSINLGSAGVISVAILSSSTFDAMTVDPDSIALAGARVKLVGKSNRQLCHNEDVNSDAFLDLVCKVETAQFMIEEGETIAVLEAELLDGTLIRGEDSIRIVP